MKTTTNHGLRKPDGTDLVNIDDLNYNADKIDGILVPVTTAKNGLMTKEDKTKLNGVATGANKYVHPNDANTRHVTDAEKAAWNGKANASHTHTKSQITDFPTSLPAKGGNADTVGGINAYHQGTFSASGSPHGPGSWLMYCKHNAFGDARFALLVDGHETRVHYATNADNCQTVKNRDLASEVDGLKQSVVNGKQVVVNAINDKAGKNTGLTTNHSFDDYAWHIRNTIPSGARALATTGVGVMDQIPFATGFDSEWMGDQWATMGKFLLGYLTARANKVVIKCDQPIYVWLHNSSGRITVNANTEYIAALGTDMYIFVANPSKGNLQCRLPSGSNAMAYVSFKKLFLE